MRGAGEHFSYGLDLPAMAIELGTLLNDRARGRAVIPALAERRYRGFSALASSRVPAGAASRVLSRMRFELSDETLQNTGSGVGRCRRSQLHRLIPPRSPVPRPHLCGGCGTSARDAVQRTTGSLGGLHPSAPLECVIASAMSGVPLGASTPGASAGRATRPIRPSSQRTQRRDRRRAGWR